MRISRKELLGLFLTTHGSKIVTVKYKTDARLLKTGNPHKNVEKTVVMNGTINYRYKNALEKKLAEIGENPASAREVHDRTWGSNIEGTPLVEYKDKHYLNILINKVLETRYRDIDTNQELSYEDVKQFLPNKDNNLVKLANISLDKILDIKMGGVEYEPLD